MSEAVIDYQFTSLYPKQSAALFTPKRFSWIEGSVKSGKTFGCMEWLSYQAAQNLSGRNQNYWWVAPVHKQAEMVYHRYMDAFPKNIIKHTNQGKYILMPNNSKIWFLSADKPNNLYGEDVHAVVLDEASRMKEDAFFSIRSTLTATGGHMRAIGNVKGRKNWFYKECRKAQMGLADNHYAKLTAYDAIDGGIVKAEEIAQAKLLLPDYIFRQDYLAEAADDGSNPFNMAAITACSVKEELMSAKEPICWGVDLAKSVDWTVALGLDEDGHVCRLERWQMPWQGTLYQLRELINRTSALVDSTGVGDPIVESLQSSLERVEGFKFTQSSKQQLMEGLAMAIQQGLLKFPEGVIVDELMQFEYSATATGVRYTAPAGMHDDCVMALALAWKKWQEVKKKGELDIVWL